MFYKTVMLLALLCSSRAAAPGYTCRHAYHLNEMDKVCIKIHESSELNYDDAQKYCKGGEADLAQPGDDASQKFIAGFLKNGKAYWISSKNIKDDDLKNARCVQMMADNVGTLKQNTCTWKGPFVCQMKAEKVDSSLYDQLSCDFETKCNYMETHINTKAAEIVTAVDHTNGPSNGHYIEARGWGGITLVSPIVRTIENHCLSFFFQGSKATIYINVRYLENSSRLEQTIIDEASQQGQWNKISASVPALVNIKVKLKVLNVWNGTSHTVMAKIDDVDYHPC